MLPSSTPHTITVIKITVPRTVSPLLVKSKNWACQATRTLIDRTFKINNTGSGFHNDVKHLTFILRKNLVPIHLIDKVLNRYITTAQTPPSKGDQVQSVTVKYFKLPHVGPCCTVAQ